MVDQRLHNIFRRGSKTYFTNSLFFPDDVKDDVFVLYSFVREADNYVDAVPQDGKGFKEFRKRFDRSRTGSVTDDIVIDSFSDLMDKRDFKNDWAEAFLDSMEMDMYKREYETINELLEYIYGSAEVIGLMMAKILGVSERYHENARDLGKSMQLINFIRDIDEDNALGRTYMPREDLERFGLTSLHRSEVFSNREAFLDLISLEIGRYREWQESAERGFVGIPKRYLPPIQNASEMYNWTASRIVSDPFIVFREKVKPSKARILANFYITRLFP